MDFEFEGFRADTKSGVFAVKGKKELFEFKDIQKYYIKFIIKETNTKEHYTEVVGARLVIELNHPMHSHVEQILSRGKTNFLGDLALSVFNIAAKKAYEKHNESIFALIKNQTGKKMSMSKKEER